MYIYIQLLCSRDICCFSTSHRFKSNTSSSVRTMFVARNLDENLKTLHRSYLKIQIHKLNNRHLSNHHLAQSLDVKFSCFKASSHFFMLSWLSNDDNNRQVSLKDVYKGKEILFSGKNEDEDECQFVANQLLIHSLMMRIKNNPSIRTIDTVMGGVYYHDTKLMFILIPRKFSIGISSPHLFMNSLNEIQGRKPPFSSNQGKSCRVLFEIETSNYVDLGVGVSRFCRGLYKKIINGASDNSIKTVQSYFNSVEGICQKFLPQCLLQKLNDTLNDIQLEDFNELRTYKQKKDNKYADNSNYTDNNNESKSFTFMPSTSFGINNFLPLHNDKDMFLSVVHIHSKLDLHSLSKDKYTMKSDIIKYFTFDNSVSVGLRSGDLLIFNPTVDHCISTTSSKYKFENNYCISHYFKTAVASRNDNSIKFDIKRNK